MKHLEITRTTRAGFTLVEGLILTMILVLLVGGVVMTFVGAVMESRTYNKLTGASTTWYDALWVELRVQDQPIK